jgi:hypothetical protein
MKKIIMALFFYVAAFMVVVTMGRARWWTDGVAFTYAKDDRTDRWLGLFFAPLYAVGRRFGLRWLTQPAEKIS